MATYLSIELVLGDVGLDEVVGAPLDGVEEVARLPGLGVTFRVGDSSPGQDRDSRSHGKAKFDKIAGWQVFKKYNFLFIY